MEFPLEKCWSVIHSTTTNTFAIKCFINNQLLDFSRWRREKNHAAVDLKNLSAIHRVIKLASLKKKCQRPNIHKTLIRNHSYFFKQLFGILSEVTANGILISLPISKTNTGIVNEKSTIKILIYIWSIIFLTIEKLLCRKDHAHVVFIMKSIRKKYH